MVADVRGVARILLWGQKRGPGARKGSRGTSPMGSGRRHMLNIRLNKIHTTVQYGLDVCCLNKTELNSLGVVINRFCMTLFSTSNMDIMQDCQSYFNLKLPSELLLTKCYDKFLLKLSTTNDV